MNTPVKDIVILVTLTDEEVTEELAEVRVVRLIIKAKGTAVVKENSEFARETTAKQVGRGSHLLFHNTVVLLLLSSGLQTLPRKGTAKEVHENVGEGLQVIATSLLNTQMSVNRGVPGRTGKVLVLSVRDMKMGLRVPELLGQTKINNVDLITTFANTHKEIVGLNIAVNEVTRVDVFYARNLRRSN